jgi:sugar lactone lactonase YvrE
MTEQHKCDAQCDRYLAEGNPQGCVTDGFGNYWNRCQPGCAIEVVRPGKAQCSKCEFDPPEEILDYLR